MLLLMLTILPYVGTQLVRIGLTYFGAGGRAGYVPNRETRSCDGEARNFFLGA